MAQRSHYKKIAQFGEAMNRNVLNPLDQSNPLSYCLLPTYNSQFLHGSTASNLLYSPQGPGCANYMAERCSLVYDGFCRAYDTINTDTAWPNVGSIDNLTFNMARNWLRIKTTVGQNMIRNAAERRYLVYPGICMTSEPFDPNVANSPLVSRYNSSYRPGPVSFKNLDNPATVDNDLLMDEVIANWPACFDVLTKIYKGWKDKNPAIKIYPSKFERFLKEKTPMFEDFLRHLQSVPFYSASVSQSDYYPEKAACYPALG